MASTGSRLAARAGTYDQDSGVVGQQGFAEQRVETSDAGGTLAWQGIRSSFSTQADIGLAQLLMII